MKIKTTDQFAHSYRRGVVLGLSLGEVFIILLFLILLMLTRNLDEVRAEKSALQEELNNMQPFGEKIEEEDFIELYLAAKKEAERLAAQVDELTPYAEFARTLVDEMDRTGLPRSAQTLLAGSLTQQLSRMTKPNARTALAKLTEDGSLEGILKIDDLEKLPLLEIENAAANAKVEELETTVEELRSQLSHEKGQLPPCWFRETKTGSLKKEREIKSFDIKISDDGLTVVQRPAPTQDEETDLGDLANYPRIDDRLLNRSIRYQEFLSAFAPFLSQADTKQIQPYRCRFHVGVWDGTSSKEIYKKRLGQVESIFFKYEYKQDPWPHEQ